METNGSYTVRSRWRGLRRGMLALGLALGAATAMAVPAAAARVSSSDYGAGYFAYPVVNGFASASATFKVPSISCTSTQSSEAIGLQVQANDTGTVAIDWSGNAVVALQCNSGTASYMFDVDAGATHFVEPGVNPGDVVVASMYQTLSVASATVHDLTSGYTWIAHSSPFTGSGVNWSVWTGAYSYANSNTWAQFTSVPFSKCQVNGDYLKYASPTQYKFLGSGSVVKTSALSTAGDGFKLTWS